MSNFFTSHYINELKNMPLKINGQIVYTNDDFENFIITFKKLYLLQFCDDNKTDFKTFNHLEFISKFDDDLLLEKTNKFKEDLIDILNSDFKHYMINNITEELLNLTKNDNVIDFYKEIETIFHTFDNPFQKETIWIEKYNIDDFI